MKSTRNTFLKLSASALVIVLSSLLFACQSTSFDLAAAKKEIEAANNKFSELVNKGDSTGIATECYTADAKFFAPNGPVIQGRKNIQSVFSALLNSGINKAEFTTIEVWGNEDAITEEGNFTLTTSEGKIAENGKYLVLWKKEDGKWKLNRDCFNSNLPVPAAQ